MAGSIHEHTYIHCHIQVSLLSFFPSLGFKSPASQSEMHQIQVTNFKLELYYPLGMHNDKITVTSSVLKPHIVTQQSVHC